MKTYSVKEYRKLVKAKPIKQCERISAAEYRAMVSKSSGVKRDYTGREKEYIERVLSDLGIDYLKEYKFDPSRRWRFDFCIPIDPYRCAIEYEGIVSAKSRHTNVIGYSKDAQKYNAAMAQGWKVLRYTALNYKDVESDLKTIFGI